MSTLPPKRHLCVPSLLILSTPPTIQSVSCRVIIDTPCILYQTLTSIVSINETTEQLNEY